MEPCPWSTYTPDPFPFCEEQLCHIIGQPANTWSNIGYLIAAIMIARNTRLYCDKKYFALVAVALAVGSTLFHMTGTLWAKYLDVGAMLLLSSLTLSFTIRNRLHLSLKPTLGIFSLLCASSFPLIGVGRWGGIIFLAQCFCAIILEFINVRKEGFNLERKSAIQRVAIILPVALVLNYMDQHGPLCWPTNHVFTVHGLWHLATAYVIYQVAIFYLLERPAVLGNEKTLKAS